MFKTKRIVATFLILSLILTFPSASIFAESHVIPTELSQTSVDFLEEHGVDISIFEDNTRADASEFVIPGTLSNTRKTTYSEANSYDNSIKSLINQAAAYNFTDEQIQAYAQGLAQTSTQLIWGIPESSQRVSSAGSGGLRAANRPGDNGIGYEVMSNYGYYEATSFAKIPTVYRSSNNDTSAYMFNTLSTTSSGMDIGIWYGSGSAGVGWRYCWLIPGQPMGTGDPLITGLTPGKSVYFQTTILDNTWTRLRVLDANNFSTVYVDISVYSAGVGITRTNAAFNRQITLCNDAANFYNGAYCLNAEFSQAYIYSASSYALTTPSNTISSRVGAFGTNNTNKQKVGVNSSYAWYQENVSIVF